MEGAFESHSFAPNVERIYALRRAALASDEKNSAWSDAVYYFDKELRRDVEKWGGDVQDLKRVPEWHALVGSTVEEHPIDPELKEKIVASIMTFLAEQEPKFLS